MAISGLRCLVIVVVNTFMRSRMRDLGTDIGGSGVLVRLLYHLGEVS